MAETDNLDDDDLLDGMEDAGDPLEDLEGETAEEDAPEGEDAAEETEGEDETEVPEGRLEKLKALFTRKRLIILGSVLLALLVLVFGIIGFSSDSDPKPKYAKGASATIDDKAFSKQLEKQKKKKKKKRRKPKKIKYVVLYKKLTGPQLSEIMRELSYVEIQYDVSQNGNQYDIFVDQIRLEEAKKILAVKEIPTGKVRGYELFDDASNLGVTEFDKRIRLIRAISGEMEKAIMRFDAIDSAQVEIVMPEERLFAVTQPPVTAAILLRSAPKAELNDELIFAIIQLVANSVENLKPANISVAETTGRVLSTGILDRMSEEERKKQLAKLKLQKKSVVSVRKQGTPIEPNLEDILTWFQIKHSYETLLEKKAIAQLLGVLPEGSYKVAVTVDLNTIKDVGTPDIRRIITSLVVDNSRDDIVFDDYTTRQIQSAVAGAIGYVRGRDTILLSKADFLPKAPGALEKTDEKKKEAPKLPKKSPLYYLKYWPVLAMGAIPLSLALLLFKGYQKLKGKKEEPESDLLFEEDAETDLGEEAVFEEPVPDFIEEPESITTEDGLEKLMMAVDDNPEYVAKLMQDWLLEETAEEIETKEIDLEKAEEGKEAKKEEPVLVSEETEEEAGAG